MKFFEKPLPEKWQNLVTRPSIQHKELMSTVETIFAEIRKNGDKAVLKYSNQFDCAEQNTLIVNKQTIEQSRNALSEDLRQAIELARRNIEKFHLTQRLNEPKTETSSGILCWREARAIERVGIYIPGGSAPLFSTVLMLAIPARIAGCKEVVLCTPPNSKGKIHPAILYAAQLTGVHKIFAVGGIQAIGAMTFGTETIPKADKIFGPGNQYVMAAKQMAQLHGTAIDMPAGPSEVLIIADASCNPAFVAADLLSQAEHGADSQVVLLGTDQQIIQTVLSEVHKQLHPLPRKDIAAKSLENSFGIYFETLDECLEFSNLYAPEHLILAVENPLFASKKVINAGSVFLGNYSCESAGDYASGTNHTLPTSAYAKTYSGVSLDSFVKKITFQQLSEEGLQQIGSAIETMAEAEQLMAHKNAVTIRLREINTKNNRGNENS